MLYLKTEKKEINLVLRTKKIIDIVTKSSGKNFEEVFFKVMYNKDLEDLSKIIYTLAEDSEGQKAFKSSIEIYDFLDDYKYENNKSYDDVFNELMEFINKEGFFNRKMSEEELEEKKKNLMTSAIDMDQIMKDITKDMSKEVASEIAKEKMQEEEFMGYKA